MRKQLRRTKFPGYVLVRLDLTDESWGAVRHTPGVCRMAPHDSSVRSMRTRTYPGNLLRRTSLRTPPLISVTSSIGTSTWKM
ncbi:MAG: transcription termination/antitermination protein NusG [Actinomycetales bacterium]